METYEVGGAIRDELLGLPAGERDWVVVGGSAAELLDLGYVQVGKDFPVFLHPETKEEYALARTERKTGRGHTAFELDTSPDVTLEQDLGRRDLTINAIARDAAGELVDPYGGRRDIERRVLRHVSEAFREDPLRVLRTARFAARFAELGFTVAPETLELMGEIVAGGELDALAPERLWQETDKALGTSRPDVFISTLRDCGALAAVFPEVERLFGVPQPERWHPEIDTGMHTLKALELAAGLSSDRAMRFAVLVHDLGKGTTPRSMWPRHRGHGERSAELVAALGARLAVPRRYEELALIVARHHCRVHRAHELKAATVFDLIAEVDGLRRPDRFDLFLLACEADARGRTGLEATDYPQRDLLRAALRAAQGADLGPAFARGLGGPELGSAIRELRIAAIRETLATAAGGP